MGTAKVLKAPPTRGSRSRYHLYANNTLTKPFALNCNECPEEMQRQWLISMWESRIFLPFLS